MSLVEELSYESRFLWAYWGDKPTWDVEQQKTFVNETGRRRRFVFFQCPLNIPSELITPGLLLLKNDFKEFHEKIWFQCNAGLLFTFIIRRDSHQCYNPEITGTITHRFSTN